MSKSNGSTRASSSGSPKGISNGGAALSANGVLRSTEFASNAKLSDFENMGQFVNGGGYSIMTADGYMMTIDTENGYNEDFGGNGTLIQVTMVSPNGKSETIINDFVGGEPFRESGGRDVYNNDDDVRRRVDGSMPYYAERANKWKKNN